AGGWLVDNFSVTVKTLTPLISSDVYASVVQDRVLQSLATRDPNTLEWIPRLARRWTTSDDGLTITFDLRPEARFSDGEPLTSEDIVFTYDWIMNPRVAAPRDRAYVAKIESVTADGPYRVVFRLSEPYFKGFETCASMQILAKHFYEQFEPEKFNEHPGLLFGSGPYRLATPPEEWEPGSGKIILERNPRYWGLPPAFDRLIYREITEETARLADFRNQEIDRLGLSPEQYRELHDDEGLLEIADLYEYETVNSGYRYIGWNQVRNNRPTPFADRRVRRALTMLIDRELLCQRLMAGLARVSTGPFHHLAPQSTPEIDPWAHNPERARELLAKAGYEDRDANGIIEGPDGRPLRFELIYPSSSANYKQMALFLKDGMARAGVQLVPMPLEWTTMLQRINDRDFDAMSLGWSGSLEGDPYQIFHSDQIPEGGDNYIHYRNDELDALIDEARVTMEEDKRMALWHRVHRILHEDQPYTFLFTRKSTVFINKRLRNVQRVRLGINDELEWFIPADQQKWTP
ncbi:MAG: peptide-binding protein, partial [Phycisphaeraceae bacterium]|nr:peptide-binding protein [Phycisphaeraceae bacterium]